MIAAGTTAAIIMYTKTDDSNERELWANKINEIKLNNAETYKIMAMIHNQNAFSTAVSFALFKTFCLKFI